MSELSKATAQVLTLQSFTLTLVWIPNYIKTSLLTLLLGSKAKTMLAEQPSCSETKMIRLYRKTTIIGVYPVVIFIHGHLHSLIIAVYPVVIAIHGHFCSLIKIFTCAFWIAKDATTKTPIRLLWLKYYPSCVLSSYYRPTDLIWVVCHHHITDLYILPGLCVLSSYY